MTAETPEDGQSTDGDPDAIDSWWPSRRRLLQVAAATGAVAGIGGLGVGQQATETYEFDGDVSAWIARAPSDIEGEENPTIELQAGQEYEVVWTNVDGVPHNFTIQDADGNELASTETMSEQGATRSLTFTATPEMARYICTVHPTTMVGDIQVGGDAGGTPTTGTATEAATETATETAVDAGFFQPGTEIGVQVVAEGMTAPTDFATAPGDDDRWFVTDQTGEVWVVTSDGRQDEPFVDVSDRIVTLGEFAGDYAEEPQDYDERGLLGIEFHPDFANNRRFYLHYSAPRQNYMPENWDHIEVISEFTATEDLSAGDPDSERKLLEIESPQYNHDAGPIAFGPDGYLYVPMGDGGGANDDMYGHVEDWYDRNTGGNGQDVEENLLGDILRIDVDAQEADKPYGIPDDNPFVDTNGLDEIYAYGFRNPFGISFDSAGNLFVADAGQNLWEEASVVEMGGNYGWNVKEGTHCFSTENPSDPSAITDCPDREPDEPPYDGGELIDPVVEYPHTYNGESVGITIIGGHRYENTTVPGLEGKYVFGTWTTDPTRTEPGGRIFAATPPEDFDAAGAGTATPSGTATETETGTETATAAATETGTATGEQAVPRDELWEMEELVIAGDLGYFVRQFGRDNDGEIYVLANQQGIPEGDTGVVLKIVPPEMGDTPTGTVTEVVTEE